ncbi:hypothetical protein QWI18_23885, partial [Pseudomonas sp. W2Oct36]|uniref:hypothetical protein n=1 Tax=Pseudomonas sp. W2Oct36 TaxID=1215284 RepID=UPI0034E075B9
MIKRKGVALAGNAFFVCAPFMASEKASAKQPRKKLRTRLLKIGGLMLCRPRRLWSVGECAKNFAAGGQIFSPFFWVYGFFLDKKIFFFFLNFFFFF